MKKIIFITLVLLSIACNNTTEKTYYKNGNIETITHKNDNFSKKIIEEYDSLGNLLFKTIISKGKKDSIFKYNKNGTLCFRKKMLPTGIYSIEYDSQGRLEKEGLYVEDTIKAYWWKFYKNNELVAKREYVIVCNNYYLNQAIIFNKKNDTISKGSTYFDVNKKVHNQKFSLNYRVKSLFDKGQIELVILKDTNCEEVPDTVIALPSNRGSIILNKKYMDKKAFFFDYNIVKETDSGKAPYKMVDHKKYFDLSKL